MESSDEIKTIARKWIHFLASAAINVNQIASKRLINDSFCDVNFHERSIRPIHKKRKLAFSKQFTAKTEISYLFQEYGLEKMRRKVNWIREGWGL